MVTLVVENAIQNCCNTRSNQVNTILINAAYETYPISIGWQMTNWLLTPGDDKIEIDKEKEAICPN